MPYALRFGAFTHQDRPAAALMSRWRVLDSMGLDHLWLNDHFNAFWRPLTDWYEAWVLLSALATQVQHAHVGTLVTPVAYRNPALLAQMAMTLDHITGGRLELGLGSGAQEDLSYSMLGISLGPPRAMVERAREAVQIVDTLLRRGQCTYQGVYYQISDAILAPAPIQKPRPSLTIAAHHPAMMRLAAQYADTWNTHIGTLGVEALCDDALNELRKRSAQFDTACLRMDRDPSTVRRSVMLLSEWSDFCASPSQFRDNIYRYRDAGFTEFILPESVFPGPSQGQETENDMRDNLEVITKEVIPELQRE